MDTNDYRQDCCHSPSAIDGVCVFGHIGIAADRGPDPQKIDPELMTLLDPEYVDPGPDPQPVDKEWLAQMTGNPPTT
jgi:hypothetical protein